jgi:hypothetical protein
MYMKVWLFLRPNAIKLVILMTAMSLTLLVVTEREATSKVTWDENRGAPLPFLTITKYRGPCPPLNFCTKVYVQTLHPSKILLDILGWYVISCTLFLGYKRIFRCRPPTSSPTPTTR